MLEGGNLIARHHGKGLERGTFCYGVELSHCLVTVRALTETKSTGISVQSFSGPFLEMF